MFSLEDDPYYPFYISAEDMQVRKEWLGVGENHLHGGHGPS